MAYLTQQKYSAERFNERKKLGDAESKRRNLVVGLDSIDRKQAQADAIQGRKELQAAQLEQRKADQAQAQAQFDQQKQFQLEQASKQQAFEKEMQAARISHDTAMERIHQRQRDGDKVAEKDDKKIEAAKSYIATLADNIDALVQSPEDIDKIETRARRFFDQQNMSKDAREVIDSYFKQEVVPSLIDKRNQALDAGSPQQAPPGSGIGSQIMGTPQGQMIQQLGNFQPPSGGVLNSLGSVRTPQRY